MIIVRRVTTDIVETVYQTKAAEAVEAEDAALSYSNRIP
jgi:hypothetical protein